MSASFSQSTCASFSGKRAPNATTNDVVPARSCDGSLIARERTAPHVVPARRVGARDDVPPGRDGVRGRGGRVAPLRDERAVAADRAVGDAERGRVGLGRRGAEAELCHLRLRGSPSLPF